jgi:hypothetical protein
MRTETETVTRPRGEVVGDGDSTTNTVRCTDGPELVERSGSDNRRLVRADGVVDVVCSTVGVDCTQQSSCTAWIIAAVRVDDVILDQRACSPAVD